MTASTYITPDILIVPANHIDGASDYIVADLHGSDNIFNALLRLRESPACRIFAAGDLTDRGSGNVEIIRAIVNNNKDSAFGKIYCVRGNHEDMCVNTIDALMLLTRILLFGYNKENLLVCIYVLSQMASSDRSLKRFFSDKVIRLFLRGACLLGKGIFNQYLDNLHVGKKVPFAEKVKYLQDNTVLLKKLNSFHIEFLEIFNALSQHQANGGKWLVNLYLQELTDKTISAADGERLNFSDTSAVMMIAKYMASLPYIIRVEGDVPFNIVHADMPIGDSELLKRVSARQGLADDEKDYAMWARPHNASRVMMKEIEGRNKYSSVVFKGHTIDEGVCKEKNSLGLDIAAYERNVALVVNMPSRAVHILVPPNSSRKIDKKTLAIAEETRQHMSLQTQLQSHRERTKRKRVKSSRLFPRKKTTPQAVSGDAHLPTSSPSKRIK